MKLGWGQTSPAALLKRVVRRVQVWRATRRVVRTLHQANGLDVGPEVKQKLEHLLSKAHLRQQDSARSHLSYFGYVAKLEKALVDTLPRAPLWGGLHPPVDSIDLTVDDFRAGLRRICPLWPFC